jgi:hypothetical protein
MLTPLLVGFAGRIIGISLAGSVFENMIQVNMKKYVPTLPEHLVQEVVNSATAIWDEIPAVSPRFLGRFDNESIER